MRPAIPTHQNLNWFPWEVRWAETAGHATVREGATQLEPSLKCHGRADRSVEGRLCTIGCSLSLLRAHEHKCIAWLALQRLRDNDNICARSPPKNCKRIMVKPVWNRARALMATDQQTRSTINVNLASWVNPFKKISVLPPTTPLNELEITNQYFN
jgi:hypothetical protein